MKERLQVDPDDRHQGPADDHGVEGRRHGIYQNLHFTVVAGDVTEEYKSGQKSTVSGGLRFEVFCAGQKTTVSGGLAMQQWTGAHKRDVSGATKNVHLGTLGLHGMSTVSETYPSGVTQIFGPVTRALREPRLDHPHGAKVLCGTFDVIIPFHNWSFINNTYTKVLKIQLAAIAFSAYALKLSRVGHGYRRQRSQGRRLARSRRR